MGETAGATAKPCCHMALGVAPVPSTALHLVNARVRPVVTKTHLSVRSHPGPSTYTSTLLGMHSVAEDLFEREQAFEGLIGAHHD